MTPKNSTGNEEGDDSIERKEVFIMFILDDEDDFEDIQANKYNSENDSPPLLVIMVNFLCLIVALLFSNLGYFVFNYFLHDLVYMNLVRILSDLFERVYFIQVTKAKWGRFQNIYLFIEVYSLLVLFGSMFVMIFTKQFFKKAMTDEPMRDGDGKLKQTLKEAKAALKNLNSIES